MLTDNTLLSLMDSNDRSALMEASEEVELRVHQKLEEPHAKPQFIYFIEAGVASHMYKGRGAIQTEVALLGREGCTGCAVILGAGSSPQVTVMQVGGRARRVESSELTRAMERSRTLHLFLLRFVHTQIVQQEESILSASRALLPERLARCLLMMQDRLANVVIPLSHDCISLMLSVRRAGITTALGDLRAAGIVDLSRKGIRVLNRPELLRIAGVYYGASEAEFGRTLGRVAA